MTHIMKMLNEKINHLEENNTFLLNENNKIKAENELIKNENNKFKEQLKLLKKSRKMMEEITQTGQWSWDKNKNEIIWSEQVFQLFEIPIEKSPTFEEYLNLIHIDDREYVRQTIYKEGMITGEFKQI